MTVQSHEETVPPPPRLSSTLCFADSMAHSVTSCWKGLSIAHLTTLEKPLWDFREAFAAHEKAFLETLVRPNMRLIRTAADLDADGKTGLLFGMRYVPDDMTLPRMKKLYDRGIRVMTLACEGEKTECGDGSGLNGGLTAKGKIVLDYMRKLRMTLDLSGTGYNTALEACRHIQREGLQILTMASHSGCLTKSRCNQDLPDCILSILGEMNGYIGIPYSHPKEFAAHAKHALKILGKGTVGICSDRGEPDYFKITRALEEEGTRAPHILGENFRRFLARALPQK